MKKRRRYTYIPQSEIAEVVTFNNKTFDNKDILDGTYVRGRKKFARGGYTYVPQSEIAEVTTYNNVSFENKDILDGAYIRGRKRKFAKGGTVSAAQQAAEAVGYKTWFALEKADQDELIEELAEAGAITMFGDGGGVQDNAKMLNQIEEEFKQYLIDEEYPEYIYADYIDRLTFHQDLHNKRLIVYFEESEWDEFRFEDFVNHFKHKWDIEDDREDMADYPDGTRFDPEIDYSEYVYSLDIKPKAQTFDGGGIVGYKVKYKSKGAKTLTEKIFDDKEDAELFFEAISDDEDWDVMPIETIKPPKSEPAKKSLFAKPTTATPTKKSAKDREEVQIDGIADDIARLEQVKQIIKNAESEKEILDGRLKDIGKDAFLELYEEKGRKPDNFDLVDGQEKVLFIVSDKYLKVEPEKAELLRQYEGLLEESTAYEFNSKLLDKVLPNGKTIGEVVDMLIQDTKLIPQEDKEKLINAKLTYRVPKNAIDNLMNYDNPREIFDLIAPVVSLK